MRRRRVPLQITQRSEDEVPEAQGGGRANEDLNALKREMSKVTFGIVLEIETGSEKAVRGTKMLVTKAAKELGSEWRHWSQGTKVFAKPAGTTRRRGRPRKTESPAS